MISIFFKLPICLNHPKYLDYLLALLDQVVVGYPDMLWDTQTCYEIPRHVKEYPDMLWDT